MTFVATANSVRHAGGVPHFVDIENRTLGIDPAFLNEHLEQYQKLHQMDVLINILAIELKQLCQCMLLAIHVIWRH